MSNNDGHLIYNNRYNGWRLKTAKQLRIVIEK